jgi:hypothetical protein
MMKKITFLFFLLTVSLGYSQLQTYVFDFESDGPDGTASNWVTFDGAIAPAEIIDNPDLDGTNPTASKVLKVVAPSPGNFYDGVNNTFAGQAFGTWELDLSGGPVTISMDVNKNYVGTIGLKMGTTTGATTFQITDQNVGNTVVNEWQTLSWTVSSIPATLETNISQFVIFIDWTQGLPDRTTPSVLHVDNITFDAIKLTDPVIPNYITQAYIDFETPPGFTGAGVTSFSESFANPDAGTSSVNPSATCAQIDGINVGAFSNAAYSLSAPEFYDFSAGDKGFTIDVKGPRAVQVRLKVEVGGSGVEVNADYTDVGNWQTLTYDFTGETARTLNTLVIFFDITGTPSTNGADDIFLFDNVNFDVLSALSTNDFKIAGLGAYPNPTQNSWTIKTQNIKMASIEVFDILGKNVMSLKPEAVEATIDASQLKSGLYFAKINTANGSSSLKLVKQ